MLSLPALSLLHQLKLRGTLTAAAAAMRLSRSAASHQLAALQRAVGLPLTEKVGRGLRLTEAGAALAVQAGRVLDELEGTTAVLETMRDRLSGTVRLAAVQTFAISAVPTLVAGLRDRHPALRLETTTIVAEHAVLAVAAGEVDVAVVPSYRTDPIPATEGIHAVRLFHDPVRLAVPGSHRLAGGTGAVSLSQLRDERWVAGDAGSYFGELVAMLCSRAGFVPDIAHRSGDYAVVASLVSAGLGVALIPAIAHLSRWPDVVVRPLRSRQAGRDLVALMRNGSVHRPTVGEVVSALRRYRPGPAVPSEPTIPEP